MTEKVCIACKESLKIKEFTYKKTSKDKLDNTCRKCKSKKARTYYELNKEELKKKMARYELNNKEARTARKKAIRNWRMTFINNYKKSKGCYFCGETEPVALDLHHIDPSIKTIKVSSMGAYSEQQIKNEIAKCVVLCANCHRKVHTGLLKIGDKK